MRGILLPCDQQLIAIDANIILSTKKLTKQRSQLQPQSFLLTTINIACSYLLQMNKPRIIIQQQQLLKHHQLSSDINRLSEIQNVKVDVFLQYPSNKSSNIIIDIHQHQQQQNVLSNKNIILPNLQSNSIIQNVMNHINSPIKDKQLQSNINKQKLFDNSKLNQDYDLIRNKTTLNLLQSKRSSQILKIFQSQTINNNKNNNNNSSKNILHILNDQNLNNNSNNNNNNQQDKLMKTPPLLTPNNQAIDQSIVIESFRHTQNKQKSNDAKVKINIRSIQILVLAILAAICFSLGANMRIFMFDG